MLGIELNTLVTYNPVAVPPTCNLLQVLRLMEQHEIHHVPVVDNEFHILGIISDFDIAQALANASGDAAPGWHARITVEEIMVRSVVTVEQSELPEDILRAIVWNGFHSVPMVDSGRLIGIVTSTDFLREFSSAAPSEQSQPVSEFMIPCRWQIEATATLDEADQFLVENSADYIGVVQSGRAVGVISGRQLRRVQLRRKLNPRQGNFAESAWHFGSVNDLLPVSRLTLYPEQTLAEATTIMFDHKLQSLAILAWGGQIDGLLTECQVLEVLARHLV